MKLNNGTIILAFLSGAAIGSVVTWKLLRTKYEQIAQEEIESVKEAYFGRQPADEPDDDSTENNYEEKVDVDFREMAAILQDQAYTNYAGTVKTEDKEVDSMDNKPYIISPDEFGENDDYETESLTYYADGVLTDDRDIVIESVDDVVGEDSLNHFDEYDYDPDSVYVRNDRLRTDYEILRDTSKYADVCGDTSLHSLKAEE